jgi:hypothetical protein
MHADSLKNMTRHQLVELMEHYPANSELGMLVREECRRRTQRWGQVAGFAWTIMLLCALLIGLATWLH